MKICYTCGNELNNDAWKCPYCNSVQSEKNLTVLKNKIANVDLEKGMPAVVEAVARMKSELISLKKEGVKLVRLIHGWGSSGRGGKIKTAIKKHLGILKRKKMISSFTYGDEYSENTIRGRDLMSKYPELKHSLKSDTNNPGITIVEI